jgi:hypothetical protein
VAAAASVVLWIDSAGCSPPVRLALFAPARRAVAFSSDNHTLATGSADTTARLWETNLDNAVARICRTTPAITTQEWDYYLPGLPYQPPCR